MKEELIRKINEVFKEILSDKEVPGGPIFLSYETPL